MIRQRNFLVVLCLLVLAISAAAPGVLAPFAFAQDKQTKRAINFDDLISMHRVGDPQISPDGKWVAYAVATPDKAANRTLRNVWLVPAAGGESRQLTRSGRDLMGFKLLIPERDGIHP